jgi:hypothetical protein
MAHVIRSIRRQLLLVGLLALLPAAQARAQCLGDCNGDNSVGPGELTNIIALINCCPCADSLVGGAPGGCPATGGCTTLGFPGDTIPQCTAADRSGNQCITAGELTGVIADILNYENGCPPLATMTPTNTQAATSTPTSTPVTPAAPTSTPVTPATPTSTPVTPAPPTNTPVTPAPPTNTPVTPAAPTSTPVTPAAPTSTPVTPATATSTPTRTNTPGPPSATSTPVTPSATATPSKPPATATPTPSRTPTAQGSPVITPNVCGNGKVESGETCDLGGLCVGGSNAGTACVNETQCIGNGVCDIGTKYGTRCASSANCDGARCIHCKTFGGGGCAANCTSEKDVAMTLVPGAVQGGACKANTSCARLHAGLTLGLPLNGVETFTIGGQGSDNNIPFVIKASSVTLARVPIASLACACVRGIAAKTCGGYLFEADGSPATDCSLADKCAASSLPPCTYVNGPGNGAAGVIGCGSSFSPVNVTTTQDAGGVAIPPPPTPSPVIGLPIVTLSGSGGAGSGIEINSIRLGQVQSTCQGSPGFDPAYYGPDGQFCTDDDPDTELARGPVSTVVAGTGVATATLTNSGVTKVTIGPDTATGNEFTCRKLTQANPSVSGSGFASAFTSIGSGLPGSGTVTNVLFAQ